MAILHRHVELLLLVERGTLRDLVRLITVAWCDDCGVPIKATFQINLKAHCLEYLAPYPVRHNEHNITFTKNGLMTWT